MSEARRPAGDDILGRERAATRSAGIAGDVAPIDWATFWSGEETPEEWLAEQIIPMRRQVAIFSPAKSGKSLLALEIAAAIATGRSVLGAAPQPPRSVVYFDFEMTEEDVRERLTDLGYGPEDDLTGLAYYQLPSLPPLDTERGGQVLEFLVRRHTPCLAVVDTMARVVQGDEDQADTYRGFYAHSGVRLKRLGVSLLRLDHAGKDITRGQRGSSAKADDVDVVFRLAFSEDKVVLTRTHSRVPWVPSEVALRRETDPVLRHVLTDGGWPAGTNEAARALDELDVPIDATVNMAVRALKAAGQGRRRQLVGAGLKWRRVRVGAVPAAREPHPDEPVPEPLGTGSCETTSSQVVPAKAVPGTAGNRSSSTSGTVFPSLEGTRPGTASKAYSDDEIDGFLADWNEGSEA